MRVFPPREVKAKLKFNDSWEKVGHRSRKAREIYKTADTPGSKSASVVLMDCLSDRRTKSLK